MPQGTETWQSYLAQNNIDVQYKNLTDRNLSSIFRYNVIRDSANTEGLMASDLYLVMMP